MRPAHFALLATLAVPAAFAPMQAHATETLQIRVSGVGEAAIAPDMALLTLTVMREAETAREALDEANSAMAAVVEAMKEEGVADRDLQTAGLSINPRYHYPDRGENRSPRIVAYQVTNTLSVRVREFERVGEILDLSVTLGVNQGGDIVLTNDDPTAALEEARRAAVEDAMSKANTLAEAAGVEVGRVLEMSEQAEPQPPRPLSQPAMRMELAADSVPVEAGENTYRVQVSVSFEILQQ